MTPMNADPHPKCAGGNGCCGSTGQPPSDAAQAATLAPGLGRRDFLKLFGAGTTAAVAFRPWQYAMAGPFTRTDFDKLVPADKKLSPAWVRSLTARGEPEVYRGADLTKIGMPIGGLCAGQLYLGGDGKLWHWDIFNQHIGTGAEHYAQPLKPTSPLNQGFELRFLQGDKAQARPLDRTGWRDVNFRGEYPTGFVEYRDADAPVSVSLEAFSPFIPLDTEESSLPATVMRFTVKNLSAAPVQVELLGWLENAVCLRSGESTAGVRRNRAVQRDGFTFLECSAEAAPTIARQPKRSDIALDDFEKETYDGWTATGTAFGAGPVERSKVPAYQGDVGLHGQRAVNSHATAPGAEVGAKDAAIGTLTSKPFVMERDYLTFLIGGGSHVGRTCLNLLVGDKIVLSAAGRNDNRMQPHTFDVRPWAGQSATLQIVDNEKGGWGNIGVDDIVLSDTPRGPSLVLTEQPDFGTMGLALLRAEPAHPNGSPDIVLTKLPEGGLPPGFLAKPPPAPGANPPAGAAPAMTAPFPQHLTGALGRNAILAPGAATTVTFLVAWHFPNFRLEGLGQQGGRWYGKQFSNALAVVEHAARHFERLRSETRRWHDTWYDSTLPYWFLDRTFLNTSILATSTSYRFGTGRFWGWEGVGCCHGTCGHVWQYAHAVARLFPELERETRAKVDFGSALQADGAIHFRGEFNDIPAIDAQAGTILRALREHQMTTDTTWLKQNWPGIRKATEWLIAKDGDADGLITGNQHNTLDTDWFGPVAWLSGLYLAALLASAEMAEVTGDTQFAAKCRGIVEIGRKNLVSQLFEDGYFLNKADPKHPEAINSGTGCHIDQVMGQSWAFQVGLPRVLPEKETRTALASLWRYNFSPDVGPYREAYKPGRWYAMPGEAGLLMCTFPRTDWDYDKAKGKGPDWAAGYFNECMNGFEYQAASHMIWEGLLTEGLAVTRAVHDRYHPARRNPFNEVECGDHYARSMASYGVFLAACGYEYDGPKAHLAFAPRLSPEHFKAAFTTARGWGSFSQTIEGGALTAYQWWKGDTGLTSHSQTIEGGALTAVLAVKWGQLALRTLTLTPPTGTTPQKVTATLAGNAVPAALTVHDGRCEIRFGNELAIATGQTLEVKLG